EYLGLPEDGLPLAFRRHTADEPAMLADPDGDKPFLNSTPVKVSWHQFVFVAAVMLSLTTPKSAPLPNIFHSGPAQETTIRPVREEWAKVPGICLFDEVGLGKTMCAMATIATLQSLYEIQEKVKAKEMDRSKLPACLRDAPSFGNLTSGIPNERHLVVVPNSLRDQWVAEITRFFRGHAIHLHVISHTANHWEDEIAAVLRTVSVPKINQILVVEARTLQLIPIDGIPRLRYQQKPNTVYALPYCSTFLDEVQDARTGKALWRAFSAILDGSLIKVPMTATPLLESPNDLINLALLVRPPSMVDDETSNLRGMSRDLRILKGKSTVRTHQEALLLTEQDKIMQQTEGTGVAFFASRMVKVVQRHLAPHTVKRTNQSLNFEGKPLGAQLPPHTMIHVRVTVTDSEADSSYDAVQDTLQARVFDTNTLGKFFNDARSKLSFPSADRYTPEEYNIEALHSDSATKLKAAIEIMLRVLRHGADTTFPSEFHSTTDRVVDAADIGLPDFLGGWEVQPLLPDEPRAANEKIILFTTYAKFHPWMQNILTCCGIRNVAISGAVSSKERTRLIEEFRHGPVDVLIMSQVGATGLNLTCARTLILYEAAWTAVNTEQTAGRIHRRGQRLPTYVIQLVADKTVEVLLIATGLGKRVLLGTFLELERNLKTFKMLAGHAGEDYEALRKGADAGDDVAEEVQQNLKSAQSALGIALQDRFKEPEDQAPKKEKQPPKKRARKAKTAESTGEKGEDTEERPKKKAKTSKVKSAEVVHDEIPARSMRLAAGPSQINATAGPSRLHAPLEPPAPLEPLEPLEPEFPQEVIEARAAEFRERVQQMVTALDNAYNTPGTPGQGQPFMSDSLGEPVMPSIVPGEKLDQLPPPAPFPQNVPAPVGPSTEAGNPYEPMEVEPVETPTAPVSPQPRPANIPGMSSDLSSLPSPTPSPPLVKPTFDAPAIGSDGKLKDASEIEFTYSESEDAPAPQASTSKGKGRAQPDTLASRMGSVDITDSQDPYRPPHTGKSKQPATSRRKREATPSDVDDAPPMDSTLQRPKKQV
ncbi:P-loop containing nucleoside triphosphate hydrolase protein, partial [Lentinula lateritia]